MTMTLYRRNNLEENLHQYSEDTFRPMDDVLREVVVRAEQHKLPPLHVGYMDGLTLEVMIRMAGYKKVSRALGLNKSVLWVRVGY